MAESRTRLLQAGYVSLEAEHDTTTSVSSAVIDEDTTRSLETLALNGDNKFMDATALARPKPGVDTSFDPCS